MLKSSAIDSLANENFNLMDNEKKNELKCINSRKENLIPIENNHSLKDDFENELYGKTNNMLKLIRGISQEYTTSKKNNNDSDYELDALNNKATDGEFSNEDQAVFPVEELIFPLDE